jgi:MFS transporter, DHA1 family, multidrug resistance protein
MSGVVYLIEVYLVHANSALAINNFLRCVIAATFPLYATDLLVDAGLGVGCSVIGSICLALSPVSFLFWRNGRTIRQWSKYAEE